MGSTTRKTRNYKEKSSMLAFGHMMLPLSILIAVGLLFLGIKLFFSSTSEPDGVEITPSASVMEQTDAAAQQNAQTETVYGTGDNIDPVDTPSAGSQQAANSEQITLASPVSSSGTNTSSQQTQKTQSAKPTSSTNAAPAHTSNTSAAKPTAARPQPTGARSGAFGVQIGAFTKKEGAESVVKDAARQGYKATISSTVSSGKTFYRVRVAAGNTRGDAERLAAELEKKGFPVSIVTNP